MRRLLLALGLVALAAVPAAAAPAEVAGWTPVACNCDRALTLDAVDAQRVYLGTNTGVTRSDDGGWTWRPTAFPLSAEVRHLSFADRETGAAVGAFEGVAVTRDGGTTWKQYRPWPGRSLDVFALPGRLFGLAESGVYSSTDGGVVWKKLATLAPLDSWSNTHWSDAKTGVVASGAYVWTTTDAGASWTRASVSAVYDFVSLSLGPHQALTAGMRGIHDNKVFIGKVDGESLTPLTLEARTVADEQVRGLARHGSTIYAVGVEGLIARSTDLGASWTYEDPPPSFERSSFYDVDALDADHAWAAAYSGRVLIRNASTANDVTTVPHKGLGIGLLALAGLAGAGAVGVLATKRPKPVAGVLAGVTLASGVPGVIAALDRGTCRPSGCGTVVARSEDGQAIAPIPSASPTPSPTPTPTPSATPSPTPSATPSPTASATPSATRSPSTEPTVVPTVGAFSITPTSRRSSCGDQSQNYAPMPVTFTLKNGQLTQVRWTATAVEPGPNQQGWATISPKSGNLTTQQSEVITVTPDAALCAPGGGQKDFHVDIKHGNQTERVTVTVIPFTG